MQRESRTMPGMTNRRTILATLFTCLVGLVTAPVAFGQGKTSENVVKTSVKESVANCERTQKFDPHTRQVLPDC